MDLRQLKRGRQGLSGGEPEQITSGATEEEGVSVSPDGRWLITSVGLTESEVWIRDAAGERRISSEGYAHAPQFSRDRKKLFYLTDSGAPRGFPRSEERRVGKGWRSGWSWQNYKRR